MKKIAKTTKLPEPTKGMKVVAQVLNVEGFWETHMAWVMAMFEGLNGEVEEVALETNEGLKFNHVWKQTKWSRIEVIQ